MSCSVGWQGGGWGPGGVVNGGSEMLSAGRQGSSFRALKRRACSEIPLDEGGCSQGR